METAENRSNWGNLFLQPWWTWQHRDLPYTHEPFNNAEDVDRWRDLGYTQSRFTGDMYDMRNTEPEWVKPFRAHLPMTHWSWSVYRMRPGDVLPLHSDTYRKFCEIYGVTDIRTIRRYIVFLEPWQSGHYFEIDGHAITNWVAGSCVYWHGDTPHIAANTGTQSRYTLQITGIMTRSTS